MKNFKALFLCALSVFLLYRSYDLVGQLIHTTQAYGFIQIIVLAFLINLFVTGVFALPGFALPTNRLLPKQYYTIKNPPLINKLYDRLGVGSFRLLLMLAFWGRKNNRKKYFDGTRMGIDNLVYQSKQSEFGHMSSFLVILMISLAVGYYNNYLLGFAINVFNILANGYPVLLQRHHRMRLQKLNTA